MLLVIALGVSRSALRPALAGAPTGAVTSAPLQGEDTAVMLK
jgi:hypothetical protein